MRTPFKIEKIPKEELDFFIKNEHYLHRVQTNYPSICYAATISDQIIALVEWSAIFKPILLRFPFLEHYEIVDNSRFLVRHGYNLIEKIPEIYNLGSRVLSKTMKKIARDWFAETKTKPKLLITYIDQGKGLRGTVYKAANWIQINDSAGKNYNKKSKTDYTPSRKLTFIYPLIKGESVKPVIFFEKEYLLENWHLMNEVAAFNYKPKRLHDNQPREKNLFSCTTN